MFQYPIDKVYTSLDKVGYIDKPKDTMNIVTYNLTNSQQVIHKSKRKWTRQLPRI